MHKYRYGFALLHLRRSRIEVKIRRGDLSPRLEVILCQIQIKPAVVQSARRLRTLHAFPHHDKLLHGLGTTALNALPHQD